MSSAEYGFFSRLLHRVALGSPAVLRATMAMEHVKWKDEGFDSRIIAPVFICGLARSGSTLLLNRLTATGAFSTSTYRHMPFVLAPNMWSGASKSQRTQAQAVERAHGDGMSHSFDSEEAFEEVFWRAVSQKNVSQILPWNIQASQDVLSQFRLFMTSVVKAGAGPRYLSKNNNNITRLPTLLKAAKTAQIVIPFRDPVAFVGSTLAQHEKFLAGHADNPFDAKYMAWLGHHEFGPYFKPAGAPGVTATELVTPEYLCQYWISVYSAVLENTHDQVHFFDYDTFCDQPAAKMTELGKALELENLTAPDGVHAPRMYDSDGIDGETLRAAMKVHKLLTLRT
ncbi:MAG: hypothetical protein ACI861_002391 [Paracoccaceae bacterium]